MHLAFDGGKAKGEFKTWCQKTSWHGVGDLATSDHWITRLLWVLVLIITTLLFTINISAHIADYWYGETWSLVTYYKEDLVNGAPFPNVTVCSLNLASEKQLKKLKMDYDAASFVLDGVLKSGADEESNPEREKRTEEAFLKYTENETVPRSLVDWVRLMAPRCEDLFDGCVYGNPSLPYAKFNCCENALELFLSDHGRCFVLHPPPLQLELNKQIEEGEETGLHLYLNPEVSDYAPVYQSSVPDVGVVLYLGFTPENSILTTPVAISPGSHTWVGMRIEQTSVEQKHKVIPLLYPLYIPDLPCYLGHELKVINAKYTFETCRIDCQAQFILELCGCAGFHSVRPEYPVCDPVSMQNCLPLIFKNNRYGPNSRLDMRIAITNSAMKECYKITVEVRMSGTNTPAPNYLEIYRQMLFELEGVTHDDETLQQFAVVDLFFDSTQIKVVELRERYPVETLISNIGGTMGVYAGISLITIYQMIVFCCRGLWKSFSRVGKIEPGSKMRRNSFLVEDPYCFCCCQLSKHKHLPK